ncbi:MAG: hypothetical protein ABIQ32_11740 [Sphingomicrobium sp.]
MARYDGELKAVQEAAFGDVFGKDMFSTGVERQRRDAIACYLSASEGWQEATKLLGGAFAPEERSAESQLTGGKAD